jgi:hypothetical protein
MIHVEKLVKLFVHTVNFGEERSADFAGHGEETRDKGLVGLRHTEPD